MMVQLERGQKGLGLSLAGHKDRNCMAVFVCGLNPNGEAYKMGGIEVGDEILEVNGIVLHGRCHLNASAIIKGLAGPVFKIVILRRKAAINDIAVRPLTQFPVTLEEEETNEERFSGYPNVRNVVVEKGNHSLGIMIIEGKHSEMGQGIFISDILDDSIADKAGLEVGEMILAVNKEVLLGANYDTAANTLKRAEGVVTLVLSNPIRKLASNDQKRVTIDDRSEIISNSAGAKISSTPRATTPIPPIDVVRPPSSLAEPIVPEDPTTCSITPGKETTIEVKSNNHAMGLFLVGGKDTLISDKIIVLEILPGGAADKDGRIQAGDQILEVNGTCLKDATNETALQTLRQILPKIKLVILRPKSAECVTIEADLARKPGKGLGLSVIGKASGKGAYVSEILSGGVADIDGKITKGDLLISINGQDVENLSAEEIGTLLKTITGRTLLKLRRYKPISN
uniref:PDZ domain-containing protein n=1 Tax=Photinus pyralis TaxID=7054 RepID=A0A1Y1KEW4_PHOPY